MEEYWCGDDGLRLANELETVIFPELRSDAFKPTTNLLSDGLIIRVRSVHEMYRIFACLTVIIMISL